MEEVEVVNYRRWYDRDPILQKSMKILKISNDEFQIKMAINLIKIIIEHHINDEEFKSVEDIMGAVKDGHIDKGNSRWYDADNTVRTAIQMLENCKPEIQQSVVKDISVQIIEKFNELDDDEKYSTIDGSIDSILQDLGVSEEDEEV